MTPSESEERYRSLFNSIDAGFCVIEMIFDPQGRPADYRFLEVNDAFERLTGLRDPLAKTMRQHVPEHEQHWFERYGRIALTGEPERFIEPAKALMGGWYEVSAFRIGGEDSRRVGVLFNDISQRMRAEEALQEASRRKDKFLATLAHELRNPLAPIRNALDILRLKGTADPDLQAARDLIDRQVGHLVRLVDDLLDVSRITFGKVDLRNEPLDLREVAREAVSTSAPLLAAAGHRLTLHLSNQPVWVHGDRVRLSQIISNLLNNAARYTPPQGTVTLAVSREKGEARVVVQDSGIGISAEMLAQIFEPFVQVEQPGAPRGGMGIGLSLAKGLVDLHGGRIHASSAGEGRGSRFVVSLPLAKAPPATHDAGAPADMARRRWLVVDDNFDAVESQASLLRILGHQVETAADGPEALRKAKSMRPEIVLLDLGMPGMDGFEVARRLRAMPEARGALLIAQTGWAQAEDRRRTREAGFDAHFAKPVDLDSLMRLAAGPG